jgi:hypothetical protein
MMLREARDTPEEVSRMDITPLRIVERNDTFRFILVEYPMPVFPSTGFPEWENWLFQTSCARFFVELDFDLDDRVLGLLRPLYFAGMLNDVWFLSEARGHLTVVQSWDPDNKIPPQDYLTALEWIATFGIEKDQWTASVTTEMTEHQRKIKSLIKLRYDHQGLRDWYPGSPDFDTKQKPASADESDAVAISSTPRTLSQNKE